MTNIRQDLKSIKQLLVEEYLKPIAPFFEMDGVTAIFVNRFDNIRIREFGKIRAVDARFLSENDLEALIQQIGARLGQKIDSLYNPILDARLPDGSRINAVMYPTSPRGTNLTIRLFPKVRFTADQLLEKGVFNEEMYAFLKSMIKAEGNGLVAGATGSGKTTVINAFANLIPPEDRVLVIEDTHELDIGLPDILYMEAPKRTLKDAEHVNMERLLVNTLRQEGKRTIVGETREPTTATALMLAINTGGVGIWSSIHANDDEAAVRRLINLLLSNDSRIPYEAVEYEVKTNIHFIIFCERTPLDGQKIVSISELVDMKLRQLFRWNYETRTHEKVADSILVPRLNKKFGL
jgi:pilus assembly protein CpaF